MAVTLMDGGDIDPRAPRVVDQIVATNHNVPNQARGWTAMLLAWLAQQ